MRGWECVGIERGRPGAERGSGGGARGPLHGLSATGIK